MDKYDNNIDSVYQLSNGVMKNKLGITSHAELEKAERDSSSLRSKELSMQPIQGQFDLPHLQAIHKKLFGDIYEWAGEVRRVDISKGNTRFANFSFIKNEAAKLSKKLQSENFLKGLHPDQFSERAAYYMGEWNVLHPFREGNGRSLREFTNQLARQNNMAINWKNVSAEQMVQASIAAYHTNYRPLTKLIRNNLTPILKVQETLRQQTEKSVLRNKAKNRLKQ
ncbi:MAG: Fic family protein [Neisseria animaloris]|nr:Fic family protein [Neisseria animaloris]